MRTSRKSPGPEYTSTNAYSKVGARRFGYVGRVGLTAVHEEKRDGVLDFTLLVEVMDVKSPEAVDFNVSGEHGELVNLLLGFTPVEAIFPVCGESFDVVQRGTIVPSCVL